MLNLNVYYIITQCSIYIYNIYSQSTYIMIYILYLFNIYDLYYIHTFTWIFIIIIQYFSSTCCWFSFGKSQHIFIDQKHIYFKIIFGKNYCFLLANVLSNIYFVNLGFHLENTLIWEYILKVTYDNWIIEILYCRQKIMGFYLQIDCLLILNSVGLGIYY